MTKVRTAYNDLELWQIYGQRCRAAGYPRTSNDAMRIADAALHDKLCNMANEWCIPMSNSSYEPEGFAETRVPIARAITAIRKAEKAKGIETKLLHLQTARAWLELPHPWQGHKTASEVVELLMRVRACISNPTLSLSDVL